MDRREMVTLKLQMGISPSAEVAPDILRAMWRQLERERMNALHAGAPASSQPNPVTTNSAYVPNEVSTRI